MAYTSGAITDPSTFMDILDEFLQDNGWTRLENSNSPTSYTEYFYTSSEGVYIAFRVYFYESTSTTIYERVVTIYQYVFQSYDSTALASEQYNAKGFSFRIHDTRTRYYIIANDRRVIVCTDMYGRSTCAYVGYILPSVSQELLPYPMFVTGTSTLSTSVTTKTFGSFAIDTDSDTSTALAYTKLPIATTTYASTKPLNLTADYMYSTESYAKTTGGQQMMIPINVTYNSTGDYGGILGMVEGIYLARAWNNVNSFDIYTDADGVEYVAISGASDIVDPILAVKLS